MDEDVAEADAHLGTDRGRRPADVRAELVVVGAQHDLREVPAHEHTGDGGAQRRVVAEDDLLRSHEHGVAGARVDADGETAMHTARGPDERRDELGRGSGVELGGLGDLGRSIVTSPTTQPPASGPIGIAFDLGDILWNLGPLYVLYMAALLSANLALVNVLPFPPLDGGRILVILLKAIPVYGKKISVRAEQLTYAVGFVALFTFLIWITVFDVAKQVGGGQ